MRRADNAAVPFRRRPRALVATLATMVAALAVAGTAQAIGSSTVAALQVGLRAENLYSGPVDGDLGPGTRAGVIALQRRRGLPANGVLGPRTRAALGRYGRHRLGARGLAAGMSGWDVAELQFLLAWHGFPSGALDGTLAGQTDSALRRFQRWAGLAPDGRAGPATVAALRRPLPRSPLRLASPVNAPATDRFGPRGARFHAGVDFPAATGTPVRAAAGGRVLEAGWSADGFGKRVRIQHANGVETLYAHLSRTNVTAGARVRVGTRVGGAGATGHATGPHLHFEVYVRGAAIDPLAALR